MSAAWLIPLVLFWLLLAFGLGYEIGEQRGWESRGKPVVLPHPEPIETCCNIVGHPPWEHLCDGIGKRVGSGGLFG